VRLIKELVEARLQRNSPEFDEYHDEHGDQARTDFQKKRLERERQHKARLASHGLIPDTYYVRWIGQYHEWYGDGPPEEGNGRYKQKGDGGRIVAINVPTEEQAEQIADQLDQAYADKQFPDKMVYNKWGEDMALVYYYGASAYETNKADEEVLEAIKEDKPKDYSKGQ
jgi:hypothetical protein